MSFCIQFFKQCANISLQRSLASAIERKIALTNDVYSRSPITIRSHYLYAGDIRGVLGDITSYDKRD